MPFQDLIFCLNMAKLFAVLISSLRLFQSRLPLNFNEFVPNLCDLAGGSLQSILILKSYSTTLLVKRSHIYGGFKWLSVLYTSTISFCRKNVHRIHLVHYTGFILYHILHRIRYQNFTCSYYIGVSSRRCTHYSAPLHSRH